MKYAMEMKSSLLRFGLFLVMLWQPISAACSTDPNSSRDTNAVADSIIRTSIAKAWAGDIQGALNGYRSAFYLLATSTPPDPQLLTHACMLLCTTYDGLMVIDSATKYVWIGDSLLTKYEPVLSDSMITETARKLVYPFTTLNENDKARSRAILAVAAAERTKVPELVLRAKDRRNERCTAVRVLDECTRRWNLYGPDPSFGLLSDKDGP